MKAQYWEAIAVSCFDDWTQFHLSTDLNLFNQKSKDGEVCFQAAAQLGFLANPVFSTSAICFHKFLKIVMELSNGLIGFVTAI